MHFGIEMNELKNNIETFVWYNRCTRKMPSSRSILLGKCCKGAVHDPTTKLADPAREQKNSNLSKGLLLDTVSEGSQLKMPEVSNGITAQREN